VSAGPLVTVVVPARGERAAIAGCIEAVGLQDYPLPLIEVFVIDGSSEDGTAEAAEEVLSRFPFARAEVIANPSRTTPSSLNIGLARARGDILCRVDARAAIPWAYISTCVRQLSDPGRVVVGGRQVARARPGASVVARGIARALRNPYATGFARYRRSETAGPTDTVYLGAFRTADLRAVGGWDQRFATNQDYELNRRLGRHGQVWFEPALEVTYQPRSSLPALAAQYRRFGRWKVAAWLEGDVPVARRQALIIASPPIALAAAIVGLRRAPKAVIVLGILGAALLDGAAQEDAPLGEHAAAAAACATIGACWWAGMAEQVIRHLRGERLLSPARKSSDSLRPADSKIGAPGLD